MRLVAGALALALFAPLARAEDPATTPPAARPAGSGERTRVPFRVVRVMPESRQALLFDRNRATHVLVETGGKLEGYTIDDIDDETVTLRRDGQEVVLAAPMHGAGHRRERSGSVRPAAGPSSGGADPGEAAPVDPYGEAIRSAQAPGAAAAPSPAAAPPSGDSLPADPSIRVAHAQGTPAGSAAAPIMAGDDGVRVVTAPDPGPAAPPTAGAAPPAAAAASPASAAPPIAAGDDG
ncbi:MAG TPA: hypothetical protein VK607_15880, partial [Kofleriaceae bacterium]|nr:hypothetical protein [Kofleriaceae bacterium]